MSVKSLCSLLVQAPPAPAAAAAAAAGGPEPEAEYQVMDAIEDSEAPEADQKTEQKMETDEQKAEGVQITWM